MYKPAPPFGRPAGAGLLLVSVDLSELTNISDRAARSCQGHWRPRGGTIRRPPPGVGFADDDGRISDRFLVPQVGMGFLSFGRSLMGEKAKLLAYSDLLGFPSVQLRGE